MTAGATDVGGIAALGRIAICATRRLGEWNLAQTSEVIASLGFAAAYAHGDLFAQKTRF
jgi:hypothetical protein